MPERQTLYYSDETVKLVRAYGEAVSRSALLARMLDRYAEVCRRAMPSLAAPEWELVAQALKERPQESASLIAVVWASIEDTVRRQELDKKGKVDLAGLLERLKAMEYAQLLAVVDFCERYWAAKAAGEKLPWPSLR